MLNPPFVASTTAPVGNENTGIVRSIARKNTIIETTAPLAANGVFVGNWHDSQADGTLMVVAQSFANVAGASIVALVIQESDDIGNANFTRNVITATTTANILNRAIGRVRSRYWRVTYTNGATAQASFELTSAGSNTDSPMVEEIANGAGTQGVPVFLMANNGAIADNIASNGVTGVPNLQGGGGPLEAFSPMYGGAFSGTASATLQGWSRPRMPTVFKQATITTASGNSAVWTPGTGNKFRLLAYRFVISGSATQSAAGDITYEFQDSTTPMPIIYVVRVGTATVTTGAQFDTDWVSFGQFGILSAAANNVLNFNAGTALTAGSISVMVAGTEE